MFGSFSANPWIITDAGNLSYWNGQSLMAGTTVQDGGSTLGFSRCQLVWTRTTPVGAREDVITSGLSWAQAAVGVATPLSGADKTSVDTAIATWWNACKGFVSPAFTLLERRWYDYQPITSRPGPVDKVSGLSVVATGVVGRLPDQLAMTQTYKTASRKHWGRSYWPFAESDGIDLTYGRFTSARIAQFQAATRTLLQTTGGSGLVCPVVASIEHHAVLGIRELQTDDIADVIRSRRAKMPVTRLVNTS